MKVWMIVGLCAVVAVGIVATQSDAAIEMVVRVELVSGESRIITADDSNVWFNLYAYLGKNGVYTDDGISQIYGALKSSNGGLQGDLSFTLATAFATGASSNPGTSQTLDGDADLDLGGRDGNLQVAGTGFWVCAMSTPTGLYQGSGTDSNQILIGTGRWHLTESNPANDSNTVVRWSWRYKASAPASNQNIKLDGNALNYVGTNTSLGLDGGINLIFVPEPMTVALLAAGGTALLAFRKRRKAA